MQLTWNWMRIQFQVGYSSQVRDNILNIFRFNSHNFEQHAPFCALIDGLVALQKPVCMTINLFLSIMTFFFFLFKVWTYNTWTVEIDDAESLLEEVTPFQQLLKLLFWNSVEATLSLPWMLQRQVNVQIFCSVMWAVWAHITYFW